MALGGYEKRWALVAVFVDGESLLLGRYCWSGANADEPRIRTFRTRELARKARKQLRSYRSNARVVRVKTTIETV